MKVGRNLGIFLVIIFLFSFLYYFFIGNIFHSYKYGKSANDIRTNVRVPIIDPGMKRDNKVKGVEGGRWESKSNSNEISHFWKIVIPNIGKNVLDTEIDMFRKRVDDVSFLQINLESKILGDSVSLRKAVLRLFKNDNILFQKELNENGIDSVFIEWGLLNLVKVGRK